MDAYTKKTMDWLNTRYKECDSATGIYIAHQPIYGFRKGFCDYGYVFRYVVTVSILKALSGLKFNSFLDAGGSEGYTAFLVKNIFKAEVKNCDISEEACKRAREIFGVDSDQADIQNLPYADGRFDVLLCSETLEHVEDQNNAAHELLRVARNAVVITVPHESEAIIGNNIKNNAVHGHIHYFDLKSFNFLEKEGYKIISIKTLSPYLGILRLLIDARPIDNITPIAAPRSLVNIYNQSVPVLKLLFNKRSAAFLVKLDAVLCKYTSAYKGIIFIILKDENSLIHNSKSVSPLRAIELTVPYYHLKDKD